MKEQFVDYETLIQQTSLLSDMELQAYLTSLSTADRTAFLAGTVSNAVTNASRAKSQRYTDMSDKLIGGDNNITSASYYLARSSDLLNIMNDVDTVAASQLSTSDINSNNVRRQYEINEWGNQNKLDTLHFMQILFIVLTFISVMLFLKTQGYISASIFMFLSLIAAGIAVITLIRRARYTNIRRDLRYWHKARFGTPTNPS